jgi:pimeloyl-ACP methyl ester carboxylesterase
MALATALIALNTSARCYPPNTRVVVFIQGLYTSYDATGTQPNGVEPHRFDTLKSSLLARGYPAERLLDYSYAGGRVLPGGSWSPRPYSCELTDRPAEQSLAVLEEMLRSYRVAHPKAHFTLVGHSLGGYLAFLEGARDAARPEGERLEVDAVITLDAPLEGVSADKKMVIDIIPCAKTYAAGTELVQEKLDPMVASKRAADAGTMAAAGIRVATLGNSLDCLYNTDHCTGGGFADDSGTQLVEGAAFSRMYRIDITALLSHEVIVADPAVAHDVADFIGAP